MMSVLTRRQAAIAVLLWPVRVIVIEIRWASIRAAIPNRKSPFSYFSPFLSLIAFAVGTIGTLVFFQLARLAYVFGVRPFYTGLSRFFPSPQIVFVGMLYILGVGLYFVRVLSRGEGREYQWLHFGLLGCMVGALMYLL